MSKITLDEERQSGKTTALALKYISEAILNPGKDIELKDHFDGGDRGLASTVQRILDKLSLKQMTLERKTVYRNVERSGTFYFLTCNFKPIHYGSDGHLYQRID